MSNGFGDSTATLSLWTMAEAMDRMFPQRENAERVFEDKDSIAVIAVLSGKLA